MDGKIIFKEKMYHMKWISSNNKILLKYLKYFMVRIVNDKTKKIINSYYRVQQLIYRRFLNYSILIVQILWYKAYNCFLGIIKCKLKRWGVYWLIYIESWCKNW